MSPSLLGKAIVEALLTSGVRDVLLAPGSCNAPTSLTLHAAETVGLLGLHVRIDEHVATFTALGMAKTSGRVVAAATTSGTAVGNLMPTVMEARVSGILLLLLTVDCPAHLVGAGANQTCDQLGVLGPAAVGMLRLVFDTGIEPTWRAMITHARALATGTRTRRPGPVRVNAGFETLLVDAATPAPEPQQMRPTMAPSTGTEVYEATGMIRIMVLAGDASPAVGAKAGIAVEVTGVPLLAGPSSDARADSTVPRYRELLPVLGPGIKRMVVFGHSALSRPVTELLGRDDTKLITAIPRADWAGPGHTVARVVDCALLSPGDPA